MGKMIFTLEVRADLSREEYSAITKYKLGDTVLYEKYTNRANGETMPYKIFV
jgi:hypothetical protein